MANSWFRVPEMGTGTDDPYRPNFKNNDIDGWAGAKHTDEEPAWIVRVYADPDILSSLGDEPQVIRLDSVPVTALNNMLGKNRDAAGWQNGFSISQ